MKSSLLLSGLLVLAGTAGAVDLLTTLKPSDVKKEVGDFQLVKVDGKNAVRLSGITGSGVNGKNLYLNGSIRLPQTVNLEGKTLQLTVQSAHPAPGFYVRAYNAQGQKPAWSFLSWDQPVGQTPRTISLTPGRNRVLNWEKAMTSGDKADRINRLQFFVGTPNEKTKVDLLITGLQVIPEIPLKDDPPLPGSPGAGAPALTKVVDLPTETVLVKDGKAVFEILHPDSAPGKAAAEKIAAAVKKTTGATVSCRPGTDADRIPKQTTIMLGNIFSNPALKVLYTRKQTAVDEFLPGKGGYTVESILEPFRRGQDVIVLGASDDAGLDAAATAFLAELAKQPAGEDLKLPLTFKKKYTSRIRGGEKKENHIADGLKTARNRLDQGIHTSLGGQLAGIAQNYLLHRNPDDAKLYVEVAKLYADSAKSDPRKFGGAWGFDSDFPSYEAISGWDLIEHDPVLTAEDRLAAGNVLLRWLHEAIAAEARGGIRGTGPVSNHLTFASLGTMAGSFYFGKYYSDVLQEPAMWEKIIRHNFARQTAHGKAHDDCDSYQWLTWRHIMVYTMAMPDETIFNNGVGRRVLEVCGTTMDNLGAQAPYGDTSGWASSSSDRIVLNMYHAATRDKLVAKLLEIKRQTPRTLVPGMFYGEVHAEDTQVLDGVKIIPLDPGYYKHIAAEGVVPPLKQCFDKFSFREKLDPEALYVLVDGINNGGHRHADANSVLRYSHFGRDWLAENDYIKNQQKYHNSLLLLYNGESFPLPDYMAVADTGDTPDFGYVVVRAAGVGPTDWLRYYVWLKKDNAWLVIDEVIAGKDGQYRLKQRWNGIGDVTEKPDGYELEQQGSSVRLQTAGNATLTVYDDPDLGRQWASYPFAKPVAHVMDQTRETILKAGEKVQLIALWHGASGKQPVPEWAVDAAADGFRVNTGARQYAIQPGKDGKLNIQMTESTVPVAPRTKAAAGDKEETAPAITPEWRTSQSSGGLTELSAPGIAEALGMTLTGTKPAKANVFIAEAGNKLSAAIDGTCTEGGDSVMFDPDTQVVLNYQFAAQQEICAVELQLWWSSTSSRNTAYKLMTAEVEMSNDNFRSDVRKVYTFDASRESHPNFGHPVRFLFEFPAQKAREVRLTLTPQKDTAIYLGEATLLGHPAPGTRLPARQAEFTQVIRVQDARGDYLVAGSENGNLFFYSLDGKPLDTLKIGAKINDLAALDVDGDGENELLLACRDAYLRAIKRDGKELWKTKFEQYRLYPDVTIVKTADLDGDGKDEILVGCDNWRTYALDRNGKEIWRFEVVHPTRAVEVADIDGDGKPEVLCGTRYMWATVLDHQGNKLWGGRFGVGCRAITAPLNGQGKNRNVVIGIDSGKVSFHDRNGQEFKSFLTGDEIFMMDTAVPRNGQEDIFVASYNGYVYRFTSDGKLIWCRALPDSVVVVRALPDGGAVAGTIGGDVCLLTPDGKIRGQVQLHGRIADILVDGQELRVVSQGGEIATLKF